MPGVKQTLVTHAQPSESRLSWHSYYLQS